MLLFFFLRKLFRVINININIFDILLSIWTFIRFLLHVFRSCVYSHHLKWRLDNNNDEICDIDGIWFKSVFFSMKIIPFQFDKKKCDWHDVKVF